MTDNEKRAHDLAILSTQNLIRMKLDDFENNSKDRPGLQSEFVFDTCGEYIKVYNAFLERLNNDTACKS